MDITKLPKDALKETALKLPLKDIFKFCRTNKRFKAVICDDIYFWQNAFAFYILLKQNGKPCF